MIRILTLTTVLASTPVVAFADFTPPQGCTAYMTVQSKSCSVEHYYTCEGDPDGYQWRVDLDENGPRFASQIDFETQWVYSVDIGANTVDRLGLGAADPASLTDLLETGRNEFDFTTITSTGEETRVVGFDELTGDDVTVDGVNLLGTYHEVTATNAGGEMVWASKGREFVHPEFRLFMSGKGTWSTPESAFDYDSTPLEFIFPDEPGFLSDTPKYECNSTMSHLNLEDPSHDKI